MNKGFTFIELLIVLVVLMTLVAWMLPKYLSSVQKEHQQQQSVLDQARAVQGVLDQRNQQQQLQLDKLERTLQRTTQRNTARNSANQGRKI